MRGRAADRFGRFVSWLSTIGITLGVMALVTVLSVMNGFERELQNNILGLMPQAVLSSTNGSLNPQQLPESAAKLQGVTRVAPVTTGDVVLQSARSVAVGVMLGIDPAQKDPLNCLDDLRGFGHPPHVVVAAGEKSALRPHAENAARA